MTQTKFAFRRKSALTIALVAVLVLVGPAAGTVAAGAPPEPPHRFFGTVTDQSDDPVGGVTIEVHYQGEVVASDTTDSEGYYDLKVPADSIDTEESTTITLTPDGDSNAVETTWESGGSTELDLDVTVEETPDETATLEPPDGGDDDGDTGDGGAEPGGDDGDGGDDGNTGGGGAQPGGGGQSGGQQSTATPTPTPTASPTPTDATTPTDDATPTDSDPATATPTADDDQTEASESTETATPTGTAAPSSDSTSTSGPGFGVGAAVAALAAAALLGSRRSD